MFGFSEISNGWTRDELREYVLQALRSPSPKLELGGQCINDRAAIYIAKLLENNCIPFVPIYCKLNTNRFGINGVAEFAKLIASGKLPAGSTLNFSWMINDIGDNGLILIIKALRSKKCSSNLSLNLTNCNITEKGAKELLNFFTSGGFPRGTYIDISDNNIGERLTAALCEAQNPLGLDAGSIVFGERLLGHHNPSRKTLVMNQMLQMLTANRQSDDLTMQLDRERLGDEGAIFIANAIIHLEQPLRANRFRLDLKDNNISDRGAAALAEALASGKLPDNTEFCLSYNKIGDSGAGSFINAIRLGQSPASSTVDLENNPISVAVGRYVTFSCIYRKLGIIFLDALKTRTQSVFIPNVIIEIMLSYLQEHQETLTSHSVVSMVQNKEDFLERQEELLYTAILTAKESLDGFGALQLNLIAVICDYLQTLPEREVVCRASTLDKLCKNEANRMGLSRFGFLNHTANASQWLIVLTNIFKPYGLVEIQTKGKQLTLHFKDKEFEAQFIEMTGLTKQNTEPCCIVITCQYDIARILHEYARMDISQIFPIDNIAGSLMQFNF